jgi:hypothetical protein
MLSTFLDEDTRILSAVVSEGRELHLPVTLPLSVYDTADHVDASTVHPASSQAHSARKRTRRPRRRLPTDVIDPVAGHLYVRASACHSASCFIAWPRHLRPPPPPPFSRSASSNTPHNPSLRVSNDQRYFKRHAFATLLAKSLTAYRLGVWLIGKAGARA